MRRVSRGATRAGATLAAGLLIAAAEPGLLPAQTVRLTGASTIRYVSARGLREDSVPATATVGAGVVRYSATGQAVRCLDGAAFCRYFAAGDVLSAVPLTQDVGIAAWGFGRGIRIQATLRGRLPLAGDAELWPRAEDRFDALEAYLEVARPAGRVRLGRQWQSSGLGMYGYDGASLLVAHRGLTAEAFGGWSLVRGLAEPVNDDALAALEPFAPDVRGVLLGSRVQLRAAGMGAALGYQREIRSDRLGLYSERATASAFLRRRQFALDGSVDADVATGELSNMRLQGTAHPLPALAVELYGRRYRPYFDLWTIWGAFTPVGFDEVGGGIRYAPTRLPLSLDVRAARRSYRETGAALSFAPLQADGWRLDASARGALARSWTASARYGADVGYGAARSQLDLRVQRDFSERAFLGIEGTVFERGSEFQLTDGVVLGAGLDGGLALSPRTRLTGNLVAYRHLLDRAEPGVDWTQLRAQVRMDWTVGSEPGMSGLPAAGRP